MDRMIEVTPGRWISVNTILAVEVSQGGYSVATSNGTYSVQVAAGQQRRPAAENFIRKIEGRLPKEAACDE